MKQIDLIMEAFGEFGVITCSNNEVIELTEIVDPVEVEKWLREKDVNSCPELIDGLCRLSQGKCVPGTFSQGILKTCMFYDSILCDKHCSECELFQLIKSKGELVCSRCGAHIENWKEALGEEHKCFVGD